MSEQPVILGRISGLFGIKGWLKVFSYTRPKENILAYSSWNITNQSLKIEQSSRQGKGLVVKLAGYDDRTAASALVGADISVARGDLPSLEEDEYYWSDLCGLRVINQQNEELGLIENVFETGANDVLVVKNGRERLIPLVFEHVVQSIDLTQGIMRVDWDPDF